MRGHTTPSGMCRALNQPLFGFLISRIFLLNFWPSLPFCHVTQVVQQNCGFSCSVPIKCVTFTNSEFAVYIDGVAGWGFSTLKHQINCWFSQPILLQQNYKMKLAQGWQGNGRNPRILQIPFLLEVHWFFMSTCFSICCLPPFGFQSPEMVVFVQFYNCFLGRGFDDL